jgi:hypothetical protein
VEHGRREALAEPRRVERGRTGPGSGTRNWGSTGRGRAVWSGAGRGWDGIARRLGGGGGVRGSDVREREKREKERASPGTIPAYVHWANTSADDHKQVGLRGSRGALCSSAKLRTSVFKPTNVIRNINIGPDEYKKINK